MLYRLRTIDRLPEPPNPVMVRGTVVHAILEDLFDRPAADRTPPTAAAMVDAAWARVRADDDRLAMMFSGPDEEATWLATIAPLLEAYFALEDPRRLEPAGREVRVEYAVASRVVLGGIVDRLDRAPDGRTRVVDYKTGRAPNERFEDKALFQMKFYALVMWRSTGVIPTLLQLMYLADGQILHHAPDEAELLATERKVLAIWDAIERAVNTGDFPARRSALCAYCAHQASCPEFGGQPPVLPVLTLEPVPDPAT